ncbi:MAG: FUSC family protein, partial [Dehalococcoidia bacterium]
MHKPDRWSRMSNAVRQALAHRSSFIVDRAVVQLAFKAAVAATIAMAVVELFHLPSSFWAPLSALTVMQTEVGSSLVSSRNYLIASAVGVLLGALIVTIFGSNVIAVGAGIFVVLLLGTWMKLPPGSRVVAAGILPVIALAASDDPWRYGAYRLADIAVGLGSAILVSLLLWPSRAAVTLRRTVADVVRDAGTVVAGALTDLTIAPRPPNRTEELRTEMRQRLDT